MSTVRKGPTLAHPDSLEVKPPAGYSNSFKGDETAPAPATGTNFAPTPVEAWGDGLVAHTAHPPPAQAAAAGSSGSMLDARRRCLVAASRSSR